MQCVGMHIKRKSKILFLVYSLKKLKGFRLNVIQHHIFDILLLKVFCLYSLSILHEMNKIPYILKKNKVVFPHLALDSLHFPLKCIRAVRNSFHYIDLQKLDTR